MRLGLSWQAHLKENFRPADQQPSEPEESTTSWWLYLAAELAEQSAACAAQAGAESAPSSLGILRAAESSSVDVRWQVIQVLFQGLCARFRGRSLTVCFLAVQALWDVALAAIQHPPSPGPVYRASLLLGEALLRWRLVRPGQRSLLLSLLSASPRDKDPQAHAVTIMGCREGLRFSSALLAAERPATDHEVQQRIEVLRSFLSHLQHCEDSEAFKHLGEACELTLTLLDLKPALSLVSQRIRDGRVVKGRDLVNLGKERSAPGFLAATAANEDFNRQLQLLQTGAKALQEVFGVSAGWGHAAVLPCLQRFSLVPWNVTPSPACR